MAHWLFATPKKKDGRYQMSNVNIGTRASTLFEAFINALNWHTSLKIPVLFVCQSNNPRLWLFTKNIGLLVFRNGYNALEVFIIRKWPNYIISLKYQGRIDLNSKDWLISQVNFYQ